jgi:murein DD-endopeptidase MepM/ murein hydrolase activator NlpD
MPSAARLGRAAEFVFHSARGSRRLVLSRTFLLAAAALLLVGACWTVALTSYVLFRDELLAEILDRNSRVQRGYEDRVDALRADAERLRRQAIAEKAGLERALAALADRQAQLERRHALLKQLASDDAEPEPELSLRPAAPPPELRRPRPLETPAADGQAIRKTSAMDAGEHPAVQLADRLGALDRDQTRLLAALQRRIDERRTALRLVGAELGLRHIGIEARPSGLGGPFLAAPPRTAPGSFDGRLAELAAARADLAHLQHGVARLPIREPIAGAPLASPFGQRLDPFFRIPAFHAGLDFEATAGSRVRATGAGRVTIAGMNGGYGLMVEVDHGDGLVTRYGHLSAVDVAEGTEIAAGTVIGRVGSTGRSTGPHLHYETRVQNEAVNPLRFLAAGQRIAWME